MERAGTRNHRANENMPTNHSNKAEGNQGKSHWDLSSFVAAVYFPFCCFD